MVNGANITVDPNIYSLYEACDVCSQTTCLRNIKDRFIFRIMDRQVWWLPSGYLLCLEYGMSQKELEDNVRKPKTKRLPFDKSLNKVSDNKYKLKNTDADICVFIIKCESNFNKNK